MAGMVRSAIRPILALALMLSLLGAEGALARESGSGAGSERRVLVVVGAEPGKARAARRLVERLGGDVGQALPIVHGFTARIPAGSVARLRRARTIRTVARCVDRQRFVLFCRRPLSPPSSLSVNLVTGASGTDWKVARILPRTLSILALSSMSNSPCRSTTMSGSLLLEERRKTPPRSGSSRIGVSASAVPILEPSGQDPAANCGRVQIVSR